MIRYLRQASPDLLRGVVLLRLDFNTEDEWRMEAALPTIRFLLKRASKIVIVSHRGRPVSVNISKGRPQGVDVEKLSLRKDAKNLEKLLGKKVVFIPHFHFPEIKKAIIGSPRGSIFLLENLRFLRGEEENDKNLAKRLASLSDYYVNDAFAVSHRADASIDSITRFLPSYGGLELESEIKHLSRVMGQPKRPLVFIFGGGKAHDKLPVLKYFKKKADTFILGGAVANTILRERGINIGSSIADSNPGLAVRQAARYRNILLPIDFKKDNGKILDVGPKTVKLFAGKIKSAKTIIWNGPLGLIEKKKFARGTYELAKAIGRNTKAFRLVGGGETVMFIKKKKLGQNFDFISTGGGAMLEFLSGKKLPGLSAFERASLATKREAL
jgi:phosphoglycerate kinase